MSIVSSGGTLRQLSAASHRLVWPSIREAFARDRLLRILRGEVCGVISGLRQMATKAGLKGDRLKQIILRMPHFAHEVRTWHKHGLTKERRAATFRGKQASLTGADSEKGNGEAA